MARVTEHEKFHTKGWMESKEDLSCRRCFPVRKGTEENEEFMEFFKWYRKLTKAESFSGLTAKLFDEIRQVNFSGVMNRTEENAQKIWTLMCTMRYQERPKLTRFRLTLKMMEILATSKGFRISLREAAEKLKRAKTRGGTISGEMTRENSPEKKDDSERRTFMEELDTELEKLTKARKLEKSEDEENEMYETEITRIYCRENGPYKITGNGSRHEIIFEGIEEGEIITTEELMRICQENGLDYDVIFEEIRSELSGENAEKQKENEEEDWIEKDINSHPIFPSISGSTVEKENFEEETTSEETSESSSEHTSDIEDSGIMAQFQVEVKRFSGNENEDVKRWITEIDRAATALAIDDPDDNNCPRLNFAVAHLTGEAADWYEDNKTAMNINRWGQGGNDRQLKVRLRAAYLTPERQQKWLVELYGTKQNQGEKVTDYAQRYKRYAKRVGNSVADVGKATTFTHNLLPVIKSKAIMLDQSTLEKAIESAQKAEMSVMADMQQLVPDKQDVGQDAGRNVYEDVKKEKTDKDIDKLTKQMEEMKIMLLNTRGRNRNY